MSELRHERQHGGTKISAVGAHLDRPSILSACFELLSRATLSMMFHSSSMLHLRTRCKQRHAQHATRKS